MESSLPSELNEEAQMLLRTQEVQNLFKKYDNVKAKRLPSSSQGPPKFLRKVLWFFMFVFPCNKKIKGMLCNNKTKEFANLKLFWFF